MLEREHELAVLADAARTARGGAGSVVLISGEAGIGKSSLVGAIRSVLPAEGRLLVGYCDDLATPRVLGPLRDLIGSVGTALTAALESADRSRVIEALRAELDWPQHPTVLVIEDAHWADDATLDALRFLVRRLGALPVVLVLTYRDGELTRDHPLRQLLGLMPNVSRVHRLRLARLSPDAVRRLGATSGLDTDEVYAVTSGNPFFVAEVLTSGDVGGVPPTIAEAVRARLTGLDTRTRDALEQLAVVPSAVERWLVEALVPGGLATLAHAEQRGVLTVTPGRVAFRHELARRAVVDAMTTVRRVACNKAVLSVLLERPGDVDLSRTLHHAAEAADVDVIIRCGPAAAREAVAAGSHREAAAHYRLVLEQRDAFPAPERAALLEEYALECYTVGLADVSVAAQREAVQLRRELGDPVALGAALRSLAREAWWAGGRPEAEAAAEEAIAILERAGDERALALALSNHTQLLVLAGHDPEGIAVGERVIAMARDLGDAALLSHSLNNVGMAYWTHDPATGRKFIFDSLRIALNAGEVEHACRAYANIVWNLIDELRFEEAEAMLTEAIELADQSEFLGFLRYMHVELGMIRFARGAWDDAEREVTWAVDAQVTMRCPALVLLGRLRNRRGQPGGEQVLQQARQIAAGLGEAMRTGPVAVALAESAWLRDDLPGLVAVAEPVYDFVRRFGDATVAAELAYWLSLAGVTVEVADTEHPYAMQAAGRWTDAAAAWERLGCPFDQAAALLHSGKTQHVQHALSIFDDLGTEPFARRARQRLRALGVSRIPRGPAPSTRDNPAGLTDRQVEVARLLTEGLSNAEIAVRLVLSVRTVDTHVAAVLDKLGAPTRREAAARARDLGLRETRQMP